MKKELMQMQMQMLKIYLMRLKMRIWEKNKMKKKI